MATGDPGFSQSPTGQAGEHPARRRYLRRWIPAMVVVAVVAGLAAVLLGGGNSSSPTVGGSSPDISSWQTYHDPMNMYSLRLPPGWKAQVSTSGGTAGDRTGSMSVTTEAVLLGDPTHMDTGAQVSIVAEPIDSDFARHWYCQAWTGSSLNSSFHGIPAQHIRDATWLFSSANAHFQLDVTIPGVVEPPHELGPITVLPPTPTPQPASVVATNRSNVNGVLASFRPSNPAPLSCS